MPALFAVTLGMWVGLLASAQVLLPAQIEAVDPAGKVWVLGVVTTAGAVAAVLTAPVFGALSDRVGRRRSWVVGGSVLCAVAVLLLSWQSTVIGIGVCWAIVHGGAGGLHATLCAVIPDRVPVNRRATVFAVVGLAQPCGLVLGTLLVSSVPDGVGYPLVAVLVAALAVPYAVAGRDAPAAAREPRGRPWSSGLAFLGADFAWALAGRFAAQFAASLATIYLLYFLRDEIGIDSPAGGVAVLSLLFTTGLIVTSLVVGRASDRLGRRKAFVILGAALMAAGLVGMALVPTWPAALVAAVALGAGYGAYLAVDQALVTQLLRSENDRGMNLGIMNMASSGAVALAPVVAAQWVGFGGYPSLFLFAAVMAVLGGLLIQPIRSVS
ncbi:MFS transporter [Spirillospora sp. CA-294931]|uniref:MFS transporter n=1 Tax=Spirillospora sp. CA-294931 TaxID=3240042 RepID=UPI003D8BB9C6